MIPFLTLFRKEITRFYKVIVQTVLSPILSSLLYLLVFGVSLGGSIQMKSGQPYLAFLIPGLMMMGLINNAFQNSSSSIITSKFSGDIEDLRVSPLTHHQIIWAMGLASVVRGLLIAFLTGLVGQIFYFTQTGEFIEVHHPLLLLLFTLCGGLIFSFCGIMIAFVAKTFDQLSAFSSFVLLPLIYLGGVFISVDHFSPFFKSLTMMNPLFYLINGYRYSFIGYSDVDLSHSLAMTFVAVIVTYIIAKLALQKGSYSRW